MSAIIFVIALVVLLTVVFAIVGFALHLLFSPVLLLIALGIFAWVKFGRRRS